MYLSIGIFSISLVTFDWIFAVLVRVYPFPPYGLWYCEGVLCKHGLSKRLIMVGCLIIDPEFVMDTARY